MLDQFERSDILALIADSLSIQITRFDASYIEVNLMLDGKVTSSDMADVPAYEIRNQDSNS